MGRFVGRFVGRRVNITLPIIDISDIPIFLLNSDNPDQMVFFPLSDIPDTIENLYVTDKAWTGTEFAEGEGTMTVSVNNNDRVHYDRMPTSPSLTRLCCTAKA